MKRKIHVSRAWLVFWLFFSFLTASLQPEESQTQAPPAPVLKDIPVPVIHVKGSHYEAGYQIGTQLKNDILRDVADMKKSPDWMKVRAEAELFLAYSKKYLPEYVTEVKGTADAVGLELEDIFPSLCEEIGDENYCYTRGCSDLIASNDVTADGSVLAAHNNDTAPSTQDSVVIVHYQVEGEPEIVTVGYGGLGISVGYNSAGISLTGNQVDSNDMRVGVPRLLKKNLGRITVDKLKEFLSDHVNYPGSICRHGKGVKTTFSVIINLTTQTMLLARGNPCEVKFKEYNFFAKK
jgi:hypothetical protein